MQYIFGSSTIDVFIVGQVAIGMLSLFKYSGGIYIYCVVKTYIVVIEQIFHFIYFSYSLRK